ncbi:hypothetical protein OUZ56_013779 [Daphnia magna]|uniref:Uncharacterized protein n=1 Tax=Daphnia magna TaxID=35525 RepID=A0ABQ9Z6X2_9CRUS|nr:hypothetical protein OUZ56_013779 [Daphnia magna]
MESLSDEIPMQQQHNVNQMSNDGRFILVIRMTVGRPTEVARVIRHHSSSTKMITLINFQFLKC